MSIGIVFDQVGRCCKSLLPSKAPSSFDYSVSIVAILKNEAPYIREWIQYHLLVGIQHFYLHDNESTDDVYSILKPFINDGINCNLFSLLWQR